MFGQDLEKDVGEVGHDPVHSSCGQPFHLCGVVDRPDVDLNPVTVRSLHESRCNDVHPPERRWNLQRIECIHRVPGKPRHDVRPEVKRSFAASRSGHSATAMLAKCRGHLVVLRRDEDPVVKAVVLDELPEPPGQGRVIGLDLQIVVERWISLERLFEGRYSEARMPEREASVFDEVVPGIEALKLGKCVVPKVSAAVGRSFERRVVEADEAAVRGLMEVGFNVPVPELGGVSKREHRIFGPALGASPMCKWNRCRRAEKRARHRGTSIALFSQRARDTCR